MGSERFDVLAVRALNSARLLHLPAYLGLRLMLDGYDPARRRKLGGEATRRKVFVRSRWRYYEFDSFKNVGRDGKVAYRRMLTGSPSTILAEAFILDELSRLPSFRVPACVFSYLWPRSRQGGRSHAFFLDGYRERNDRIATLLSGSPGRVVITLDVKDFYPSVDTSVVERRFRDRMKGAETDKYATAIERFVHTQLTQGVKGIPIGPALGHVLAHLALERVDKKLTEQFGDRYLRYVDDIAVVVDAHQQKAAIESVKAALAAEGLRLNQEKTGVATAPDWNAGAFTERRTRASQTFDGLLWGLLVLLGKNEEAAKQLEKHLKEEGFRLPFDRLRALAAYGRVALYFQSLLHAARGPRWVYWALTVSPGALLRQAIKLRGGFLARARELAAMPIPEATLQRKWLVQKCRYFLNRLLYMVPPEEVGSLTDSLSGLGELDELRLVVRALIEGDATGLLHYPGRAVAAFCQFWSQERRQDSPRIDWGVVKEDETFEALLTMACYGVANVPSDVIESAPPYMVELLRFGAEQPANKRANPDLSYSDELRALQLGTKPGSLSGMLTTRFSPDEGLTLEALALGADIYASGA